MRKEIRRHAQPSSKEMVWLHGSRLSRLLDCDALSSAVAKDFVKSHVCLYLLEFKTWGYRSFQT